MTSHIDPRVVAMSKKHNNGTDVTAEVLRIAHDNVTDFTLTGAVGVFPQGIPMVVDGDTYVVCAQGEIVTHELGSDGVERVALAEATRENYVAAWAFGKLFIVAGGG